MKDTKIAWLLTSAFYYWQPSMSSLTKLFPDTTVFTSRWHGFAPGLEDTFRVDIVGERKIVALTKNETSYGDNFTYLPLNIVGRLFKFKPDVIFSNSFGVWTILALLFKPFGRWRVIIAYEGSSPGVDYRNSPPRIAVRQAMVKVADACISNSQAGKDYLIEILKAKKDKVFVQPYEVPGVNSLAGKSTEIPVEIKNSKHPVFIFVGGIIPRKGLDLLLEACTQLKQKNYENYTLLVIGDGQDKEKLERFSQEKGISSSIKWIGRVDYHCVGNYFQEADVFILPTLEDTWGMVVLEAMVLGKAILCSQFAGAKELIEEGKNGYCFNPKEPKKLAELMSHFIDNPELAVSMGNHSKEIMTHNTPEIAAQFMSEITSFVLEKKV